MTWYYAENNAQQGPVSDDQLRALAAGGRINGQTLVWKDGMANWTALEQAAPHLLAAPAPAMAAAAAAGVPDQAFPALGPETALCSSCNRFKPLDQIVMIAGQRVCADCKQVSLQRIRQGETPGQRFRFAGFWIRFVAVVLDGIILMPISVGLAIYLLPSLMGADAGAQLLYQIAANILGLAYKIFFNGKYGATPGKMVVGIRVVRQDGSSLGFGLAAGRALAEILSGILIGIGYLIAAFDAEKRSLHDRICNTRVIYK
ncbi:MAG: RDD family protein [Verrucomicrobia bacterium]|nr:RDD family protein [Verrucomicrobiota bacterium]